MIGLFLFLYACKQDPILDNYLIFSELPVGFPIPEIPNDNPLTFEKIELGKALFFDPILSKDSSISCSSCHQPELAFSDAIPLSLGVENKLGFRNAISLTNVAYQTQLHRDGAFPTLETQIAIPIQAENEMNFNMVELADRLTKSTFYNQYFISVFGESPTPFGITRAIACYERTLISGNSKYDQVLYQLNNQHFSDSELEGEKLFFSDALNCSKCHSGFNFTNNQFENNGLYTDYTNDTGRERITELSEDIGKFKIPTLRNIAYTAPYMHDGSIESLEQVIDFYASGTSSHPNKSSLIQGFSLTEKQKTSLISFLKTLSDESFILKNLE